MPFAATLFVAATTRQTLCTKDFQAMCGSVAANSQNFFLLIPAVATINGYNFNY